MTAKRRDPSASVICPAALTVKPAHLAPIKAASRCVLVAQHPKPSDPWQNPYTAPHKAPPRAMPTAAAASPTPVSAVKLASGCYKTRQNALLPRQPKTNCPEHLQHALHEIASAGKTQASSHALTACEATHAGEEVNTSYLTDQIQKCQVCISWCKSQSIYLQLREYVCCNQQSRCKFSKATGTFQGRNDSKSTSSGKTNESI